MDPQVRTSFIPKKPIETGAARTSDSAGVGLLFFISVIIFIASVVVAGGAFLYEKQLVSSIDSKSKQLDRAREQFEPATIQKLIRLNDRMTFSKGILDSHLAVSSIFNLLAVNTLSTVSFKKFNFELGESVGGSAVPILELDGVTNTFSEIALQSDAFGKLLQLKDTIFSNFNVQENGSIVFSIKANIDHEFLLYRTLLATGGVAPASNVPTQPATNTQGTVPTPTGTSTPNGSPAR